MNYTLQRSDISATGHYRQFLVEAFNIMGQERTSLDQARRAGMPVSEALSLFFPVVAESLFSTTANMALAPAESGRLLEEYHKLVDLELLGSLTRTQAERLDEIEQRLDDAEEQKPAVRLLYQRLDEDNDKLDKVLAILERQSPVP